MSDYNLSNSIIRVDNLDEYILEMLTPQEAQEADYAFVRQNLQSFDNAFACFAGNDVVAIGGLCAQWENHAMLWCILSSSITRAQMLAVTRIVKAGLQKQPFRRISATALAKFDASSRWLKMLGFNSEGLMRSYYPTGEDAYLYAFIK